MLYMNHYHNYDISI